MLIPLNILNVSKIRILFFIVVTEPIYLYHLIIISNYIIKSPDKNSVYEEDEDEKEDEEEEKDDDEMDDEPLQGNSPHY